MNLRRIGRVRDGVAVALAATLFGCVTYAPKPLDDADVTAVLTSPDRATLERAASSFSHPLVRPIALDLSRPLSPDAIGVLAVLSNPTLRSARAQQGVADAQVFAAGLLPDPQVSLGIDKVLSPSEPGLSSAFATALTLDALGGLVTRPVERRGAVAAARQVRLDIAWQEWTVAGEARLVALRLPRQRLAARIARAESDASAAALQRTLAAAVRGDLKSDDVASRRIAAADDESRALAAERDADASQQLLNRLLGLTPAETVNLVGPEDLATWQRPDADALFETARRSRLDLRALAAGYDHGEAALQRAILGQYPRFSLTLNRARDTSKVHTFGPAVTLDVPLWNRNRGEIANADAAREQLRREFAERLFQTRADISTLVDALERDEKTRTGLVAQLPGIDEVAERLATAARRGDVTSSQADSARASATDKHLALIAIEQSCAEQRLALELAVGLPLSEVSVPP